MTAMRNLGQVFFRYRSLGWLVPIGLLFIWPRRFCYPFQSFQFDEIYEFLCLGIAVLGEMIRVLTVGFVPKGTSGRNTTSQKAAMLNRTGMYSVVRNPLYLGNYVIMLGISSMLQSWQIALINSAFFAGLYLPIILAEEHFLLGKFGQAYRDYAARVPLFLPHPWKWVSPEIRWSWRMALRREQDTAFAVIILFVVIDAFRDLMVSKAIMFDLDSLLLGGTGLICWTVAKSLKKFTRVLSQLES
jgi:protein-S-isoprenylcysteine O-methyltransferase Ste14